jgi:branched-chain amino acid aminotransferase
MPVTQLDGHPVCDGRIGPMTRQLQCSYWHRTASDPRNTPVPYEHALEKENA